MIKLKIESVYITECYKIMIQLKKEIVLLLLP